MSKDLLFKTEDGLFSYRIAGILIKDDKVLLQQVKGDPSYAIPGGHVSFGETSYQAIIREFKEETHIDVEVNRLLWIGENFFPWGKHDCHQICLYYLLQLKDKQTISDQSFDVCDEIALQQYNLKFSWVPLNEITTIVLYPLEIRDKLIHLSEQIEHFIYQE